MVSVEANFFMISSKLNLSPLCETTIFSLLNFSSCTSYSDLKSLPTLMVVAISPHPTKTDFPSNSKTFKLTILNVPFNKFKRRSSILIFLPVHSTLFFSIAYFAIGEINAINKIMIESNTIPNIARTFLNLPHIM